MMKAGSRAVAAAMLQMIWGIQHIPGNARIGLGTPILFDWGDSRIGNPVLDLAVLNRLPGPARDALADYWLRTWKQALPGSDPEQAWHLLRPLAALRTAAVYQHFLDNIEPGNGSTTRRTCAQRSRSPPASPLTTPGDDAEAIRSPGGRRWGQDLSRFSGRRDMCPAWRPFVPGEVHHQADVHGRITRWRPAQPASNQASDPRHAYRLDWRGRSAGYA